jgi:acetate---CoA ligase (ADP-forming)
VPLFRSADRALRALAPCGAIRRSLATCGPRPVERQSRLIALPGAVPPNGIFAEYQGKAWLARAGLVVPQGALATTADDAVAVAQPHRFSGGAQGASQRTAAQERCGRGAGGPGR